MKEKKRIPTAGPPPEWGSPFEALQNLNPSESASKVIAPPVVKKNRGRVDILRQTAHRGGKTVTVVKGLVGVGPAELKDLGRALQKACGAGGTAKDGCIEIQGDHRDVVARILKDAGFRPVLAGG